MENWERHCDPQIYRKDFIRRCSQTFTTFFRPIKGFICNCNTDPSSIFKTSSTLGQKIRLPTDFKTEIEYFKYILNYCLTRLDTLDEITSENPVPRNAPSSDETPPPPQTTSEQKNETTIPNTESALQSAASNDDENEIEMLTMSNKWAIHEVSSEEEPTSPLPTKRTAPGPLASGQDGTFVPKGAERGGPSKISTFCPYPPRSGGQGSSGRDRSPIRLPDGTKPSVPPKPGNQSKSKKDKNSPH